MVKNTQVLQVKVIVFILFFLIQSTPLTLQAQEFYLGLKTGYGHSDFSYKGTSSFELSPKQLVNIGLTYNYKFSNQYGLNIETGFSNRGVKIDNTDLDYRLNQIDLPILLDYYPVPRIRLNIGPEITHLISARNKLSDGSVENIRERFDKKWAINGAIGANYNISFFLDAGFRYHIPFSSISESDATLDTQKIKSRYFQIYLLFKIAN